MILNVLFAELEKTNSAKRNEILPISVLEKKANILDAKEQTQCVFALFCNLYFTTLRKTSI